MELKEINSLVELFFKKFEEKFPNVSEKKHEEIFLTSLKNKDFSETNSGPYTYSWGNIETKIKVLSNYSLKCSAYLHNHKKSLLAFLCQKRKLQ